MIEQAAAKRTGLTVSTMDKPFSFDAHDLTMRGGTIDYAAYG